jgi:tripartite-type tricarboxylate transporter receptor subunit TctC
MPVVRTIAVVAALSFSLAAAPVAAQTWPVRPLTMVAPFAAGGSSDAIARILAEGLRAELGQSVIVENVGGAGGMIGASRVAKAPPDGYQFVLGNIGTHSQNQSIYKRPLYNAATDFAPVGLVVFQSFALVTRKDFPADNLQEFIAYAKANDGKLQFGSGGAGSSNHLACVLLDSAIGFRATHVPYRGASEAMADTLAGRLDYQCPSLPTAIPQIKAKAVKALAVLSRTRSPSMPDLPTAEEQGLADFDITSWYGLFLPRATPAEIVQKLNRAMVVALQTPAVRKRMEDIGSDFVPPDHQTPEYLAKFVDAEIAKWAIAIKASGIQME